MVTKHVVVLPYDKQWKQDFLQIKDELQNALIQDRYDRAVECQVDDTSRDRVMLQNRRNEDICIDYCVVFHRQLLPRFSYFSVDLIQ